MTCNTATFIQDLCLENIDRLWAGVVFELILFIIAFVGMNIVCDEFLAPALETLCERRRIPEHVAGATFMALASGMPELVISSITALQTGVGDIKDTHPEFALAAVFGSGLIAFLLIPAMCMLGASDIICEPIPLARDIVFYTIGLGAFVPFLADSIFQRLESGSLMFLYLLYLSVIVMPHVFQYEALTTDDVDEVQLERDASIEITAPPNDADSMPNDQEERSLVLRQESPISCGKEKSVEAESSKPLGDGVPKSVPSIIGVESVAEDWEERCVENSVKREGEVDQPLDGTKRCFLSPMRLIEIVLRWTNVDASMDGPAPGRYCIAISLGFAWVTAFSFTISAVCSRWSELTGASSGLFGTVVVALGAQVPDIVQSMAVAKRGMGSMAMSNAIGSQNFNLMVALSVPWFIIGNVEIPRSQVVRITMVTLFMAVAFVGAISFYGVRSTGKATIHKKSGIALGVVYICTILGIAAVSLVFDLD